MNKTSNYTEVILKRDDIFRRLFWIRESGNRPGIRFGFIDKGINGAHNTYYEDGNCHLESNAGVLSEYPFIIEANRDDSYYILGYSSIPLDTGCLEDRPTVRGDAKIIKLKRGDLGDRLGVFLYLVRRGREPEALDGIMTGKFHQKEDLVYEEVIKLDYLKDFSLITLISRYFYGFSFKFKPLLYSRHKFNDKLGVV